MLPSVSLATGRLQALFRPPVIQSRRLLARVINQLEVGADPNAPFEIAGEITRPLHALIQHAPLLVNGAGVMEVLLASGADPEALDGRARRAVDLVHDPISRELAARISSDSATWPAPRRVRARMA